MYIAVRRYEGVSDSQKVRQLGRVCKPYPGYAGRHKKGRFHVETPNRVFLYGTGSASSPASMPKSEHGVIVRCALRYGLQDVPVLDDLAVL
jgi:hypothetical protein